MFSRRVHAAFVVSACSTVFAAWTVVAGLCAKTQMSGGVLIALLRVSP